MDGVFLGAGIAVVIAIIGFMASDNSFTRSFKTACSATIIQVAILALILGVIVILYMNGVLH